jgi:hypothetical protein
MVASCVWTTDNGSKSSYGDTHAQGSRVGATWRRSTECDKRMVSSSLCDNSQGQHTTRSHCVLLDSRVTCLPFPSSLLSTMTKNILPS